jgi:hypothetical protein
MAKIETIVDTLDFAKELAWELELRDSPPTKEDIYGALHIMDSQLQGCGEDIRTLIFVDQAYLLPTYEIEVEMLSDAEIENSTLTESVVKARIDHFEWVGSLVVCGFGLRVFGVDVIEPFKKHEPTAFIPLESINLRLAA